MEDSTPNKPVMYSDSYTSIDNTIDIQKMSWKKKWPKLSTTVGNTERDVRNRENKELILKFYEFRKRIDTSERYQKNNLNMTLLTLGNFKKEIIKNLLKMSMEDIRTSRYCDYFNLKLTAL